jgi:hypothetical protein
MQQYRSMNRANCVEAQVHKAAHTGIIREATSLPVLLVLLILQRHGFFLSLIVDAYHPVLVFWIKCL